MLKTLLRMGATAAVVMSASASAVVGQSIDPQAVLADKNFLGFLFVNIYSKVISYFQITGAMDTT